MDANMYVETTGVFSGQTLNFTVNVLANTLAGKVDANGKWVDERGVHQGFCPRLFVVHYGDHTSNAWVLQYQHGSH